MTGDDLLADDDLSTTDGISSTTADFLRGWFGDASGYVTLFAVNRTTGRKHTEWVDLAAEGWPGQAAAVAARLGEGCCVWHGVATRRDRLGGGQRGGGADCLDLPGLWLDVDTAGLNHADSTRLPPDRDAARQLLDAFELSPTVVTDTGGGLQAFWLFDRPRPAQECGPLLTRWQATWEGLAAGRGWHIDNVADLARIMRTPGTFNRKGTAEGRPAQPVAVIEAHCDRRYTVDDLDLWLDQAPTPPAATQGPQRQPWDDSQRPGDAYNQATDAASILLGLGWVHEHTDGSGDRHYTRPGKDPRNGASATVYADDGHTTIWSDTVAAQYPGIEVRRPYDAFGLFAALFHGGDFAAATRTLSAQGYGPPRDEYVDLGGPLCLGEAKSGITADGARWASVEYLAIVNDDGTWDVVAGAEAVIAETRTGDSPPVIPAEWWDRFTPGRPWLTGVRQMAQAREMVNPDSLLVTVIARAVAAVDWRIKTPNVGQGPGTLNIHTYTAAPSGGGKGAGNSGARALVAEDVALYGPNRGGVSFIEAGPGSGEGITKAYWGEFVDPATNKPVQAQTERHVLFIEEEGGSLDQLSSRSGSTLPENLRKSFMGEGIRPSVRSHSERLQPFGYRMALILNVQVHLAGSLFDDRSALGGTLQRVLWAAASDLTPLPDGELPPLPPEPPPLDLLIPAVSDPDAPAKDAACFVVMTADRAVSDAYRRRMRRRDAWSAHEPYMVVKLASLFALIGGRWHVTADDWEMATGIVDYSAAVRGWVHEQVRAEMGRKAQAATRAHVSREVETDQAKTQAHGEAVELVAAGLVRHIAHPAPKCPQGGCRRRCLTQSVRSRDRGLFAEAIKSTLDDGRIIEGADGVYRLGGEPQ